MRFGYQMGLGLWLRRWGVGNNLFCLELRMELLWKLIRMRGKLGLELKRLKNGGAVPLMQFQGK